MEKSLERSLYKSQKKSLDESLKGAREEALKTFHEETLEGIPEQILRGIPKRGKGFLNARRYIGRNSGTNASLKEDREKYLKKSGGNCLGRNPQNNFGGNS